MTTPTKFDTPTYCWTHAVLHAVDLIQITTTAYHTASPSSKYVEIKQVFPICDNTVIYRYHHPNVHHGHSHQFGIYVINN
jgi:hypothetical protein